ncbi:NACHT domain-containing protein [Desulfogranum marinum]|uniref:NACHT domain-containing protein n=1 Tax=Desulfogranum marinum TaxID=453220 RepID=UPI0029C7F885|nr:leucine-rich repeat domain-containing protein [Desulfogranum marinum]
MKKKDLYWQRNFSNAGFHPLRSKFLDPSNNNELLIYYQNIRKKFLYTTNLGLAIDDNDFDKSGKPVLLNNLFVPPLLSVKPLTPEDVIKADNIKQGDKKEILQVLRENHRVFVLGIPGSGKTTLLQWLLLSLSYSGKNHIKSELGNLVPFVMILRELPMEKVDSWKNLWEIYVEYNEISISSEILIHLMEVGQVLFLIDGLDEISDFVARKKLFKAIREGMYANGRCRFVITSRIVGFSLNDFFENEKEGFFEKLQSLNDYTKDYQSNRIWFDNSSSAKEIYSSEIKYEYSKLENTLKNKVIPATFNLIPFDSNQVRKFIINWYKMYEVDTSVHVKRVDDLISRVKGNDGLGQLSRIPVLLNMICFIHARRARLPDGRAELFERIVETYLVSLDRARGLEFDPTGISVDFNDLSNWLALVALSMQKRRGTKNDTVIVAKSEIEKIFLQGLEEKGIFLERCQEQCNFILEYITKRSGFLVPVGRKEGEEVYAFNHLSFQEYFAARALDEDVVFILMDGGGAKEIKSYLDVPHWLETFVLLFELQKTVKKADRLARLLFTEDFTVSEIPYSYLAKAHVAMDTAVRLSKGMRDRLIGECWRAMLADMTSNILNNYEIIPREENYEKYNLLWELQNVLFNKNFDSVNTLVKIAQDAKRLNISGKQVNDISCLSKMKNLEFLSLIKTSVVDINCLSELDNLKYLLIDNALVEDVGSLSRNKNLESVFLKSIPINDVSGLASLTNIVRLAIESENVCDVSSLGDLKAVHYLSLNNTSVDDISVLSKMIDLSNLQLDNTLVGDIDVFYSLKNIRLVTLNNTLVEDVGSLSSLKYLKFLFMSDVNVEDISKLSGLSYIEFLFLNSTLIGDIDSVKNLTQLKSFSINNTSVDDISALEKLRELNYISLSNTLVSNISSLEKLTNLEKIFLDGTHVNNISCLSGLDKLTSISLNGTPVNDISCLAKLENLKYVHLDNTQVSDVSSLSKLKNLEVLSLVGTPISNFGSLFDKNDLVIQE